jgi:hypothetical protein
VWEFWGQGTKGPQGIVGIDKAGVDRVDPNPSMVIDNAFKSMTEPLNKASRGPCGVPRAWLCNFTFSVTTHDPKQ